MRYFRSYSPVQQNQFAVDGKGGANLRGLHLCLCLDVAPLAGKFNDEPLWDDYMEAIREYRKRVNEQDDEDA